MYRLLPVLLHRKEKPCRACRELEAGLPCYDCTFNLKHPPPDYTSLPQHRPHPQHTQAAEGMVAGGQGGEVGSHSAYLSHNTYLHNHSSVPMPLLPDPDFDVTSVAHGIGRIGLAVAALSDQQQHHHHHQQEEGSDGAVENEPQQHQHHQQQERSGGGGAVEDASYQQQHQQERGGAVANTSHHQQQHQERGGAVANTSHHQQQHQERGGAVANTSHHQHHHHQQQQPQQEQPPNLYLEVPICGVRNRHHSDPSCRGLHPHCPHHHNQQQHQHNNNNNNINRNSSAPQLYHLSYQQEPHSAERSRDPHDPHTEDSSQQQQQQQSQHDPLHLLLLPRDTRTASPVGAPSEEQNVHHTSSEDSQLLFVLDDLLPTPEDAPLTPEYLLQPSTLGTTPPRTRSAEELLAAVEDLQPIPKDFRLVPETSQQSFENLLSTLENIPLSPPEGHHRQDSDGNNSHQQHPLRAGTTNADDALPIFPIPHHRARQQTPEASPLPSQLFIPE
ncbi:hypothetical protein Pmani_015108 [Petrolisthes manimaculis]|uniref:Uncharacterized protein n=1 Tax=Petrolisthes manimaculis TaxID=1843537 RepID=A0AAE1PV43_9EUCA|nr:hypothetical protein Pmani_015108 [Petrolisthes manimaculis]